MQDPQNREVMAALYRILEKYEQPRDCDTDQEILNYFEEVRTDIQAFYTAYWDKAHNYYAKEMSVALYAAISNRFKEHHDKREHRNDLTRGGMVHT